MFTGIVHQTGRIAQIEPLSEGGLEVQIEAGNLAGRLQSGDSVSVDGVCLTVSRLEPPEFRVQITPETLRHSTLGRWEAGAEVNLEPSLAAADALGGHLIQGHVDGVGRVSDIRTEGNSRILRIGLPEAVSRYCVIKGSLAINGVSLTLSGLNSEFAEVTLIPQTLAVTNLVKLREGDGVNLEADLISKYVELHVQRILGSVR